MLGLTVAAILLFSTVAVVVKVPAVQSWLVSRVASYLSMELNTKVSVESVNLEFFRNVSIEGLYIEDQLQDTLVYVPKLEVKLSGFNYKKNKATVSSVRLVNAHFELRRSKDKRDMNFDFISDYFASEDTSSSAGWDVKLNKIILENATFSYRDYKWNDQTPCIDFEDILLSDLNLQMSEIQTKDDTVLFSIDHLSAKEKSGFRLQQFSSAMKFSNMSFASNDMKIKTPNSDIDGSIAFAFKSWDDFDDFIAKVNMNSTFQQSKVSSEDLKYFASELIGLNKTVLFKGKVRGTVDNLKCKNLEIIYTPQSLFRGNLSLAGLPDFEETFIDMMAEDLRTNKKDIESIPLFPFVDGDKIKLPPNISELGQIKFNGKFTGFYNDFVAYGNASTGLGFVSSDINLKLADAKTPAAYKGNIITNNFNIGKLLGVYPEVGEISCKVKVEGNGIVLTKLNAGLQGSISSFNVKGYSYSGVEVKGDIARKLFNGELTVRDPNADLDFAGRVDFSNQEPVLDFTTTIRKAKIAVLKLVDRDESANFTTQAELHFKGNSIDNIIGTLSFANTNYTEFPRGITINNFDIDFAKDLNKRNIKLASDFADATLSGEFNMQNLFESAVFILSKYIPSLAVRESKKLNAQSFNYEVMMKETRGVLDVMEPDLSILAGTKLEGSFNTLNNTFTTFLNSDEIIYKGIRFSGVNISSHTNRNLLNVNSVWNEINVNDSLTFRDVKLTGTTSRDSADFNLVVANTDSSFSKADVDFDILFSKSNATIIKLIPKELLIEKEYWQLDTGNWATLSNGALSMSNFNFKSNKQELKINGEASGDSLSTLHLLFSGFNSAPVNSVLKTYDVRVGGIIDGTMDITNLLKKPIVEANLKVDNLSINGDTLGYAEVTSAWNTVKNKISVDGSITRGGEKNIIVNGNYIIKNKGDEIDFDITVRKTYLKTFSHYLDGLFSNVSGIVSGEFTLKGNALEPELTGIAHLQKVGLRVDYLNTSYSFSADVELNEEAITFDDVVVNDMKGNKAVTSGKITHDNLKDFYFDIDIAAQKSQVLNTSVHDNELFYGTAYGSGNINISGYLDYIKMDIALRSEKGTVISIPLNNPEEVDRSSFITFIKTDTINLESNMNALELSGIDINMEFEVTTDATIKLIFDDKIGDKIEGNGSGAISMKVNDAEGFQMFGNYYIDKGQYLFTLQNVINKPFTVEKGGSISWSGDPYDAEISLNAVYNLKAGLYELLQDTTSGYRSSTPVNLKLLLKDKLFNPTIGFDIEVQNVDAATSARISRLISTEEEKYKQAVSLLVLKKFSPPDELGNRPALSTSGALGNNAYEFLSNQLSNWASQISNKVNVGINYNPGGALSEEELVLMLSTSLWNDRITIEGNIGYESTNYATTQNSSNIAGDFSVEAKPFKDERIRLKAFNRSNNNSLINNLNSQYTQGIGVFYLEEFNSSAELRQRWRERWRKNKNKAEKGLQQSQNN